MKLSLTGRYIVLLSIVPILLGSFLIAISESEKTVSAFNHEIYQAYLSQEIDDLDELIQNYDYQQLSYIQVAPPDPMFVWSQGAGIMLFDPKGFPASFILGLVPDDSSGITIYPITVAEDPVTRDKRVYNAYGQEIAVVPPRIDYNRDWIVLDMYPNLYTSGYSTDYIEWLIQFYDPSRVMIRYDLILKSDLIKFILKVSYEETLKKKDDGGGIIMMAYNGPAVTNLIFTSMELKTNGIMLTLAYPFNLATYPANCYTNKVEFFTCANLLDMWCESKVVTNVSSTTNWIEWVDTESTSSNAQIRFYFAGNADLDSDGDGIADARERFVFKTNPNNPDSNGNGIFDWYEYFEYGTDPDPLGVSGWLVPFTADFEQSNGYNVGTLGGQNGWFASTDDGVQVQDSFAVQGARTARLVGPSESMTHLLASTNTTIVTRLFVYLDGNEFVQPTNLPSEASSLVSYNVTNGIVAFNGNGAGGGTWTNASNTLLTGEWVEITIEQNYASKTWDLAVNGVTKLTNLGFRTNSITQPRAVHVQSGSSGAVYCDNIRVSTD